MRYLRLVGRKGNFPYLGKGYQWEAHSGKEKAAWRVVKRHNGRFNSAVQNPLSKPSATNYRQEIMPYKFRPGKWNRR